MNCVSDLSDGAQERQRLQPLCCCRLYMKARLTFPASAQMFFAYSAQDFASVPPTVGNVVHAYSTGGRTASSSRAASLPFGTSSNTRFRRVLLVVVIVILELIICHELNILQLILDAGRGSRRGRRLITNANAPLLFRRCGCDDGTNIVRLLRRRVLTSREKIGGGCLRGEVNACEYRAYSM